MISRIPWLLGLGLLVGAGCSDPSADVLDDLPEGGPAPVEVAVDPEEARPASGGGVLAFALSDDGDFDRMGEPQPGDWLAVHDEPGQTFEEYLADEPVRADDTRRVLAFLPVGDFREDERAVAEAAIELAGIWYQIDTRILEGAPLPSDVWSRTQGHRGSGSSWRQYQTRYFLDRLLPRNMPEDAVCLIGVTMGDLYPHRTWNYVFGQADLRRRVGVYSLARYFDRFWGEEDDEASRNRALRRACMLVSHEIGHTFGMEHCTFYDCNMNGSNSLEESDRRPLRLCPVCLRKLHWNRGFDVEARYEALRVFYREHELEREANWVDGRLRRIRAAR